MEESALGIPDSGESSQPIQQSSGPKRNKISRACDECRKRKVRCDGAQPCQRCQKSGSECVFVKVTPKRGPPKQYVETLEPRLRNLEQVVRALLLDTPAYESSEKSINHKNSFEFMPTDPTSSASSSSSYHTSGSIPTPTPLTPQMETMGIGSTGQAPYVQDCLTRVDRIPNIYDEPFGNKMIGDIHESPQPRLHSQTLANTAIQPDLIQLYFIHVHPYLPILHKATFQNQLQSSPCILLLNAIYAVASRWHQPTRDSNDGHPIGWRYYQAAFSLIDIYTDTPRLSTIQALLLLVKYQEHVRRSGYFWRTRQYFQLIVRMSQDLGIAKALPQGVQMDAIMAEQRKRTFWAVYAYDVLMSTELGTEPHFKDTECTAHYPIILADEVQMEEQEAVLNFHWMAKLVHLHSSILSFARQRFMGSNSSRRCRGKDDSNGTFRLLQQRLEEMSTNMTSVIKTSSVTSSNASSFQYMLLHLSTILLHRPYALDSESSVSQERCTDSASAITHIAETMLSTGGIECMYYPIRGIQHTIHCLSAAITVHKCLAGIQGHQEACTKSLAVMNQLLESTPAAEVDVNWTPEPFIASPYQYAQQNQQQKQQQQQQANQQQWSSMGGLASLNPSASRSSPVLAASASSGDMMRTKSRRTSLASIQTGGTGGKRRARAGSHIGTNGAGNPSPTGTRNPDRMLRSMASHHRLSMPIMGYSVPQQQPQQQAQAQPQPQMTPVSYSQPPSPTAGFYSNSSDMYASSMTANKPSPFYKQALRSSSVAAAAAAQQHQQYGDVPPTRTASTPYLNRVPANQRRHTISGAYQGSPYIQQQQQPQPQQQLYLDPYQQQTQQEQPPQPQPQPVSGGLVYDQPMLLDNAAFPMDPATLDPPTESMMELLNQTM